MTIPTLITNNQEKGWQTAASTFEAKFGQALKVMNTQNVLAGLNTTENFVAELQRHMKINKVCDNSKLTECFTSEINGARSVVDVADATTYENDASKPTKTNTLITADKIGQKDWGTNTMGLQFANGVSAIVAYNPKCSANPFNNDSITVRGTKNNITFGTDCVAMVYDTQAFKNPNELNKDIRTSSMASIEDSCVFRIEGKCVTKAPFSPTGYKWNACQSDGSSTNESDLAFINKYKLAYCMPIDIGNTDYWAAAVKECTDIGMKLPTMAQLEKISSYLYVNSTMDTSRAISLGFTIESNTSFVIWGDALYNTWHASGMSYLLNGSSIFVGGGYPRRDQSFIQAICLE